MNCVKFYQKKELKEKILLAIVQLVRNTYPKSTIFSIPQLGYRTRFKIKEAEGGSSLVGVSDLIFLHNGKTIFIVAKTDKGKQTDYQKDFQLKVEKQGHLYVVVRSVDDCLKRFVEF